MTKIVLVALLMSLMAVTVELSIEQQAQADSYIGRFREGYNAGKEEGADDALGDNGHNSRCPPNDSLTWGAGYKAGYEVGYLSGNTIQ